MKYVSPFAVVAIRHLSRVAPVKELLLTKDVTVVVEGGLVGGPVGEDVGGGLVEPATGSLLVS